ncbi:S-layer homology domain-containing protein [Paenibacillus sp. MMS18-CY102]|uniref:S-layer homology domain-containing protein n=1 Tax=Paenibacillus sp. MMS18-CY102 TaxID=2682849 RepID=UPI001365DA1B|nr:S-layer homology domain-containing protein [Paenibacillus sp. MMS18-CY102]
MKGRLAKWLLAAMFVAVIQPLLVPQKAEAALPPVFGEKIDATEDKSYDNDGDYNNGVELNTHIVGYQRDSGHEYGNSILAIKFPLTAINSARTIEQALLYLSLKSVDTDTDVPDAQETYKIFTSTDLSWGESNGIHVNEASLTPVGVYGIDVFQSNVTVNFDIASNLNAYRAANPGATAITIVVKGPLASDLGGETANGKSTYTNAVIYDRTYSDASKRTHLDIYYAANSAPTDIALSNASVNENLASGTTVGTLSATDVDASETFTYSLVSGAGSADNASFTIDNNQLKTAATFDKETKDSYSVNVQVKDSANNTYEEPFTITVNNVNEAPTGTININAGAASTGSTNATLTLTASDPDAGDTLTMSFSNDGTTWSTPVPYANSASHTLSAGAGTKTVYYKLTDALGLTYQTSDTIVLDTAAPTGSVSINGAAALTNNASVNLTVAASDPTAPIQMQFSNDGSSWSGWETYNASKSWTLAIGDGTKTVSMQLRDGVGNVSTFTDDITLDTTAPVGTVVIASGATAVNTTAVQLQVGNADATAVEMQFRNESGVWSSWVSFAATSSWVLSPGDGTKTVSVQFKDAAGNVSSAVNDTITLDTAAPVVTGVTAGGLYNTNKVITFSDGTGVLDGGAFSSGDTVTAEGAHTLTVTDAAGNATVITFTIDKTPPAGDLTINNGDTGTNSTSVSLAIANADSTAVQMQFSNDGTTWSGWEAYGASKLGWGLSNGDGSKTVHVQLKDAAGNVSSATDSIMLDTTPPDGSVVIKGGAAYTNDTAVQLTIANPDGSADLMRIQNAGGSWSGWQAVDTTVDWSLSTGDGLKTVNIELKDALGNVYATSDTITLDQTAPTVTGVADNGLYNMDRTISFLDGSGLLNGSPISSGAIVSSEGVYTLVVTDLAGNHTDISFEIDKTPPAGTITINSGAAKTKQLAVSLALTNADGTAVEMQFSNDGTTWSGWEAYAAVKSGWSLTGGDGSKTVHVQLKDEAGNISSTTDSITLDTTPPDGTVVIEGGAAYTNNTAVQLTIANPDGSADTMRIQNAGGTWSSPQAIGTTAAWTLTTGEGLKTVNVELSDELGNVYIASATITLDQTAPTVNGVTDNGLYNTDRLITFSDGIALLNGSAFSNGTTVSSAGTYTLAVTDAAGNHTDLSFEIDKTPPAGTITINSGAATTNQLTVSLSLTNTDSTAVEMQFSNDGTTWSGWETYAAAKSGWTLSSGDGSKTVHVQLKDAAGNVSSATDSIVLDSTPPNGSVVIEGGAAYTNTTAVQLTIANADGTADRMRIQNDGGTWSSWQAFDTAADWTLTAGEGLKTVNVELEDDLNNVFTVSATITLDQTAPTVSGVTNHGLYNTDRTITFSDGSGLLNGSSISSGATVSSEGTYTLVVTDLAGNHTDLTFEIDKTESDGTVTINNGDTYTTDTDVDLTITNPDGTAVQMQFSNDGTAWSGWETLASTSAWTLDSGDGSKTVSIQLKDAAGNVYTTSDTITLDTTPPDGTLVINSGETTTNATSANLTISNPDHSAVDMQFQNDGGTWSSWELLNVTKAWTLPAGEGLKTINLRLKDAAGNVYETSASITLDTTAPIGAVTINNNDSFASSLSVQLDMTSDGTATQMRFSNDASSWSSWESYQATKAWTLQSGDGTRTVYMEVQDAVGNINRVSDAIVVDMTSPTGTAAVNGGAALTTDANVTIGLTVDDGAAPASGVAEASVSVDGGSTWSSWAAITPQLSAALTSGYGTKTVQVKVRDAAGNESAAFSDSIEMRSVPVLADRAANGTEDTVYTYSAADFGYSSADGEALYQIKILALPAHGALKLDDVAVTVGQQIAAADITKLAFTPDKDWNGHTTLKWSGGANGVPAAGEATIDLAIAAVNDAPVAQDGAVTVTGNAEAKGTVKATDIDGDTLTYSVATQPATGTLALDAATGAFTFKPVVIGKETFTFRAYDGVAYSDPMTVTVTNNASPIVVPPVVPTELPISVTGTDATKLKDRVKTEVGSTDLGKTVTAELGGDKWKGNLPGKTGDPFVIVINPKQDADAGVLKLDPSMAKLLGDDKRDLVLELDGRTIRVSADMLKAFASQMTDPSDVLRIELAPASEADANKAAAAVKKSGAKLAAIPMHYQVYIDRKGKRIDLAKIKGYVAVSYRPEELTAEPTTAALLLPNGKLKSLPTRFVKHDKQTEIRVHGLTQGTFVLISMNGKFTDTPKHWAEQSINGLANRLIISGVGNGLFDPNRTATRAEFSSILVQAFGLYGSASNTAYSDANPNAWYGESLAFASGSGLITGYADGTFRPDATITREEAMVILARAAELVGLDTKLTAAQTGQALSSFSDAAALHSWSRDAAALCVSLGIVNGIGGGLQPGQPITRAQLAVMVENLLKKADYI